MATAHGIAISAGLHGDVHAYSLRGMPSVGGGGLTAPDQYEAILGRKLSPTPPHLTDRILYVPSHNDQVTHLPLYDFTTDFKAAVKDDPIGSSRFKTSFGLMHKPIGDGRGTSTVCYLLDFEPLESRKTVPAAPALGRRRKSSLGLVITQATVQRRMLGASAEVGLTIPPHPLPGSQMEDGTVAYSMTPSSTTVEIQVKTSFPISATISKFGSSRHPWFTFTVPSLLEGERTFQWQIHPVEHGLLRYTLVELPHGASSSLPHEKDIPFSAAREGNENLIRGIYHNVGLGFCLSQPYSEGALLLQNDLEPELEALMVASLLGLLWRVRSEEMRPRKSSKSEANTLSDGKKSVSEKDAPAQTGSKKKFLNKILRKKKEETNESVE